MTASGVPKGGAENVELKSPPGQIIFFADLQCFAYQENVDGFLLLSKLKTVGK